MHPYNPSPMLAFLRKVHQFFVGREPLVFVAALVILLGVWGFV